MKGEFLNKEDAELITSMKYWKPDQIAKEDPYSFLLSDASFLQDYQDIVNLKANLNKESKGREETKADFTRFILKILEIIDFWDRIFEEEPSDNKEMVGRLRSGYELLVEKLAEIGIRSDGPSKGILPRDGKDIQEGIERSEDLPEGTICEIIKKTYLWNDKILRKSKIIIIKN